MATPRRRTLLICPITAGSLDKALAESRRAAEGGADAVEWRLDYLDTPPSQADLAGRIDRCPLPVIATCRPERQGGRYHGDEERRLAILTSAARAGAMLIDVEADVPAEERPDAATILSEHDFEGYPDDPDRLIDRLEGSAAGVNKIAFAASNPEDALKCFDILRRTTKPTIALAMGEAGQLSRLAAGKFNAYATFAALSSEASSAPGQPTLEEIRSLYRWDDVDADTQLMGVIGCPVGHSMSPAIHNAAMSAANVDGLYVPLLIPGDWDNFRRFMDGLVRRPWLNWRGLSVTIPHKQHALRYVGDENCDPVAASIGAINTITFEPDGKLRGDNTDYAAAIGSLAAALDIAPTALAERHVAILGAGGVARALVAALRHYGATVTVYNRTLERAESLSEEFGADAAPLQDAASTRADILVNCTSVGMHPHVDTCPVDAISDSVEIVFDTIYNPVETRLLAQAARDGRKVLTGVDMFVEQGAVQFEIWTGKQAPREVMRRVILSRLSGD
jgi:3-dehydroquinate dehydratase/shikimate dehydrogenase